MLGILAWCYANETGMTDATKIQKIANNCNLKVKDDTIQLLRKRRREWGTEYVYRIPLGLSFEDFEKKLRAFEDGLNVRRSWIEDIRGLKLDRTIIQQIKKPRPRKEILMEYDGTLKIKVYNEPLPKEILFNEELLESCKSWKVLIGESRTGRVYHNFEHHPHLIVAGTTRYGKSVFLKNVVTTLIHNKPHAARIHLIDLKGGLAFQRFKNARPVVGLAKDAREALVILTRIVDEMKNRQIKFLEKGYEDIVEAGYHQRDFIIVDEGAELSPMQEPDTDEKKIKARCEKLLAEIARIGGGLGYRLVYATQYPTGDILPRQVKQNATSKLCFLLDTEVASKVVLDEGGAEKLPWIKGRAIYKTDRKTVVQTPLITNDFIQKVIEPHINIREEKNEHSERKESRPNIIKFEDA
jgi:S-DNA-T family DNA segregation ATPase FtsK/SpoIIIE